MRRAVGSLEKVLLVRMCPGRGILDWSRWLSSLKISRLCIGTEISLVYISCVTSGLIRRPVYAIYSQTFNSHVKILWIVVLIDPLLTRGLPERSDGRTGASIYLSFPDLEIVCSKVDCHETGFSVPESIHYACGSS